MGSKGKVRGSKGKRRGSEGKPRRCHIREKKVRGRSIVMR